MRSYTYAELKREVDAVAAGLRSLGVGKGDPVAVFMPMVAEAVIAAYAIAKLGALYMPIFSGFAPSAVASRLQDAKAKVIITADGGLRRGSQALMKPVADEAVAEAPSVEHVVVLERLGADVAMTEGRDLTWDELRARGLEAAPDGIECEDTESEDVLMIAYTSGTTGRPKGAVHVHGGFLVKMASEAFYQADLHPDETLYWVTDMGWIMGPWEMVGAGCIGATRRDVRGRARLARARPRVGVGRAPPRERARGVADADPGAAHRRATSTRQSTTSRACACSGPPASRGTRSPTSGCPRWSAEAACRSSTSRAARRWARAS